MKQKFFRRLINLSLALAMTFTGVVSVLAADGSLDPTFGEGGKVTTDFGGDEGFAVVIQPDGKIVVAGYSNHVNTYNDFTLARYNTNGSLDTSFDTDGKVTTDFGNTHDSGLAIALQPDGKIIVVGNRIYGGNYEFGMARYNHDGTLDSNFGTDGKVITDFSNNLFNEGATAVALQPDGKIIVVGYSYFDITNYDIAIARFNADGSLDASFDIDGKVITDVNGSTDQGLAVVHQPDGRIIVAGYSHDPKTNSDIALLRYHTDGSLDTTFGADGIVITNFGGNNYLGMAMILQPDSKIVVAGTGGNGIDIDFALARYHSDGSLDSTFDLDGIVTTDFGGSHDYGSGVALQRDGRIIVAGYGNTDNLYYDFELARYNGDGSLDTTFGADGKVRTDFADSFDTGYDVAIQSDGKIIVVGGSNADFALARYDGDGSSKEVIIDIKPGRFPNRIELEKNVCKDDDNLYVAILTTPDFDAVNVDASSLTLGDPNLSGTAQSIRSRTRDVDLDGDNDLALAFPLCDLVNDDALNTSTTELVLTGSTLDGISFTGRDSVKVTRDD